MSTFTRYLVILGLCAVSAAVVAEQATRPYASLPYATAHKVATMDFRGSTGFAQQTSRITITSTLPGVKVQDIKLYIDSRKGRIPLTLKDDGTFVLPLRADLLAENPQIVSNQPKSTLTLQAQLSLSAPPDSQFQELEKTRRARYRFFFNVEEIATNTLSHFNNLKLGKMDTNSGRSPSVLTYTPPRQSPAPSTQPAVVIHSRRGDIHVTPDHDGIIRIVYDSKLAEENPWVTLPPGGRWKVNKDVSGRGTPATPN